MFSIAQKVANSFPAEALPDRSEPIPTARKHFVNGRPLAPPYPEGFERVLFGMGCFWGAERQFWQRAKGSTSPLSAMPAASRPIRPMRKPAPA